VRVDLIGGFLDMQQAEAQWGQLSEGERGEVAGQLHSGRDFNERVAARTGWQGLPASTLMQLAMLLREREQADAARDVQGITELPPRDPVVTAKIQEVINATKLEGNPHMRVVIGEVTGAVAERVSSLLGRDVAGYRHVIDVDAVRHILREHGDAKAEARRGQVGITEEDIQAIPEIIANPDRIILGDKRKNGQQAIIYLKRMPDGSITYVVSVGTRQKRFLATTLYKKIPATVDDSLDSQTRPPYVRNGSGVNANGESQSADVNTDADLASPLQLRQPNAAARSLTGTDSASGILAETTPQFVGEGKDTILLTPDAVQRRDALANQSPVVVTTVVREGMSNKEREAEAEKLYPRGKEFTNRVTGRKIRLVRQAREKMTFHSANLRTLRIMPHLGELIENAVPLYENRGGGKHWHNYGALIEMDKEQFFVRLVAYENVNGELLLDILYDAQVSLRETVEGLTSLSRSSNTNQDAQSRGPSRDKLARWWRKVKEQEGQDASSGVKASPLGLGYKNAVTVPMQGEAGALAKTGGKPVSSKAVIDALGAVIEAVGRDARSLNRTGRMRARVKEAPQNSLRLLTIC